jgi:hypothetical protein
VGAADADTSEELVLAAADGELVNRALDRLSTRHRQVLTMREGSGWSYQQIADHEGVEIGTVETLLWRARQALKREFALLSESKEALAGFLVAAAALFRRIIFRIAHRGASMHSQSGNSGGFRNAVAGIAVTGAAVAAVLITPHAHSSTSGWSQPIPLVASSAAAAANPTLAITKLSPTAGAASTGGTGTASGSGSIANGSRGGAVKPGGTSSSSLLGGSVATGVAGGLTGGVFGTTGGQQNALNNTVSGLGGAVGGVGNTAKGVTGGVGGAVGGAANSLTQGVSGAPRGLSGAISGLLGGVTGSGGPANTPSPSGSGSGGSSTGSTAPTTNPGLLGGLTQPVGNTLNGLLGG